jgi:bromodomain and WD repeat domain containing protein 1/3
MKLSPTTRIGLIVGLLALAGNAAAQITFAENYVSDFALGPIEVSAADIDGDGDMDVASVAFTFDSISWWENDGLQGFVEHVVQTGFDGPRSIRIKDHQGNGLDLDQDGDVDMVATAFYAGDVVWLENDGSQSFTSHLVTADLEGAHTVDPVDLDQDGDFDLMVCGYASAWFENDGAMNFTRHDLNYLPNDMACSTYVEDMDADGDLDILEAREGGGGLICYRNDGAQNFTTTYVEPSFFGAHTAFPVDLDLDSDMDVIACSTTSGSFYWWENDGTQTYTKHLVASAIFGAIWIDSGDFDEDGDMDLVTAAMSARNLSWFENDGSMGFTKHTLTTSFASPYCIIPADIDNDDDLDFVAAGRSANKITWWENDLKPEDLSACTTLPSHLAVICNVAPNPFNPSTRITFELQEAGYARMAIYDLCGRLVATIVDERLEIGRHQCSWDGNDSTGSGVAAGAYLFRLQCGRGQDILRAILIK